MSILSSYKKLIDNKILEHDFNQENIIKILDDLNNKIIINLNNNKYIILKKFLSKLFYNHYKNKLYIKGIYLYSDVGRGKTMLMDLFYNNLKISDKYKLRVHYHVFMQSIHNLLEEYSKTTSEKFNYNKDPIEYIIKYDFKYYKVICLDEFIVNDIADAVILSRIIKFLIKYNIILVTTSNFHPDDLYKNGLQRSLFLPAIEQLKHNLNILKLDSKHDYRIKIFKEFGYYFVINNFDDKNTKKLENIFNKLTSDFNKDYNNNILILDRNIKYIAKSENTIWFNFDEICNTNRSQNDYIEIAKLYSNILISNVYQLSDKKINIVRRLINLIDILYDHKVKLIMSTEIDIDNIYLDINLKFEFARTLSRLKEMQTEKYINQNHIV